MRALDSEEVIAEDNDESVVTQETDFLDKLIVLSKRRKFIFLTPVCTAVLTAIMVLLIPNRYSATTVILPPNQNSSSMSSALLGQIAGTSALASLAGTSLGMKTPGDMYVSLLRSQTVEDALIQRFGLMARYRQKKMVDARRAFEDHSAVLLGAKDGLIRITVTDKDPRFAATVANAYVDEFRKLSSHLAITEASQRRQFFQQQLLEANQNLAAADEAMKRTQLSTGMLQVDSQARSLIETAASLRGQIAAREVQLEGMRSYATNDNPDIVMAEQQLNALKAQLAKLAGTDQNASSDIIVPKGNIPEAGMKYLRSLRDVKYYGVVEELIAKEFEMAKLDEAREGAIVQVADIALPPDKKSFPPRTFIVILMTFVGFSGAMLWVLVCDKWSRMQDDPAKRTKIETLAHQLSRKNSFGDGKVHSK